jgi:hypothetical protein
LTIIKEGGVVVREHENNNARIIALKGGKRPGIEKSNDGARIEVEGELIDLGMFVLSGEDINGRRVLLTWNCNIDEMVSFAKTLDVVVTKRIEQIMDID